MTTLGGGEILRAVMTKNAVHSNPFWYTCQLSGQDGSAPPPNVTTKQAFIQTKAQSLFLLTSITGMTSAAFVDQTEFVNIFDANDSKPIVNGSSVYDGLAGIRQALPNSLYAGFFGDTLQSAVTLPAYILWKPNSLIGVQWMGHNQALTIQLYRYLILAGIEYHLEGPRQ